MSATITIDPLDMSANIPTGAGEFVTVASAGTKVRSDNNPSMTPEAFREWLINISD